MTDAAVVVVVVVVVPPAWKSVRRSALDWPSW